MEAQPVARVSGERNGAPNANENPGPQHDGAPNDEQRWDSDHGSDEALYVSSDDEVKANPVWAAEPQNNCLKRAIVRFGISYDELRQKPNYWTIEKQMAEHRATQNKCEQLEAEVERLKAVLNVPKQTTATNTEP